MEIKGTAAVVTGGTGGLGRRICRALALEGANVALTYAQSRQVAEEVVAELNELGPRAIAVQTDVSSEADTLRLARRAMDEFGRVDILVNDAAYNQWIDYKDLDSLTLEVWQKMLAINTTGPFLCAKAVAPIMRRQQRGRIVNISSVAGLAPTGSSIAYAVSKAALIHLTRCLAVALAPHVLVNSIAPGYLEGTRMSANLSPEYAARSRASGLLGRPADKDDVAAQVVAFVRTESITGQTLCIDAGRIFH